MVVDINNSTQMSLTMAENKFALLVRSFAREISIAVLGHSGYVFMMFCFHHQRLNIALIIS
jgi:hypothetical protein